MKNKFTILVLGLIALGCSSVNIVDVDQEEGFDLSKYKTFAFYQSDASGDAIGENYRENLEKLKTAITKQMTLKGVTQSSNDPDLLINIGVVVVEKMQTRETNFSNPADRGVYISQRNYTWDSQEIPTGNKYKEGSITLDLVERVANKMVWQGTAESVLPGKDKNVPPLIEEAMEKLFAKLK